VVPEILAKRNLLGVLLMVCLAILTPNIDLIVAGYATQQFNFSNKNLGNTFNFGIFFYLFGLFLYAKVFRKTQPKAFYALLLLMYFAVNLSFFVVVSESLGTLGIKKVDFMTVFGGAQSFISSLMILPVITVWCGVCPNGLEATSISFLTGISNFCVGISGFHGSFAAWALGITDNNSHSLWKPVFYQSVFLMVVTAGFWAVRFPKPTNPINEGSSEISIDFELK
jgi:Na+/melibiose symporter-like transporter